MAKLHLKQIITCAIACSLLQTSASLATNITPHQTGTELQGTLPRILTEGTYFATGQLIAPAGDTVRIRAGVTIHFKSFAGITVKGMLYTEGEPGHLVVLTSIKEAADEPKPADWNGVKVDRGAIGVVMNNTFIRYSTFGIEISSGETSVNLREVSFYQNGLSNLIVGGNQILGSDMTAGSRPITYVNSDNKDTESSVAKLISRYPNIAGTTTGILQAGEYFVDGTLVIPEDASLTINSPSIIRFTPNSSLLVKGRLETDGGLGSDGGSMKRVHGVTFTSYRDGTPREISGIGPQPCDWGGVRIASQSAGVSLKSVKIDYSTYGVRIQGSALVHGEDVDFGTHNGILSTDGFRTTADGTVRFDR